jgi:biotin-(acetyl-CoA carboxylase) ligase
MVRLLTDAPDAARALLAPLAAVGAVDAGPLAASMAELWEAFGSGAPPVTAAAPSVREGATARVVVVIDEAPRSQFDQMTAALRHGTQLPDGLVTVAAAGARFRGQRGRAWAALRGNLHLCAHYRLDLAAAPTQATLTMLPVVAAAEAVERVTEARVRPTIKWVNDLLLGGRKVGGVLTATHVLGASVTHAVFGIGLNVAQAPSLAPQPPADAGAALVANPPGCLADVDPGLVGALPAVLAATVEALDEGIARLRAGDLHSAFERYRERAGFVGQVVTIYPVNEPQTGSRAASGLPTPLAQGRVAALLPDLSLVIEGHPEPLRSGRMVWGSGA